MRFFWLDVHRLAKNLLRPGRELSAVRYFTAPLLPDPADNERVRSHTTYMDALATLPELSIHHGYYI